MRENTTAIVGTVLGFEKEHEIFEGVDWDRVIIDQIMHPQDISKDDIFSVTPTGKSFFDYENTFMNFKKLYDFFKQRGQMITLEDMKKVVKENKTVLDLAAESNQPEEIFIPELWQGYAEEMENLWYSIPKHKRGKFDFDEVRQQVAELEGGETREVQLKASRIRKTEMQNALREGRYKPVEHKFKKSRNDDGIRLADAHLLDDDGDHTFCTPNSWNFFQMFLNRAKKHGEVPDTEFYHFKRADRPSLIESAFDHYQQDKIFNERVFAGRPEDLVELYESLTETQKGRINIDRLLTEIVIEQSNEELNVDEIDLQTLSGVFKSVTKPNGEEFEVRTLGLPKIWQQIDRVAKSLAQKDEKISLDLMRLDSGIDGENCLMAAARQRSFGKVADILIENGETLSVEDMTTAGEANKTLLQILRDTQQLDTLLSAKLWQDHPQTLSEIWKALPGDKRTEMRADFESTYQEVNRISLRALVAKPSHSPSI